MKVFCKISVGFTTKNQHSFAIKLKISAVFGYRCNQRRFGKSGKLAQLCQKTSAAFRAQNPA
jgi:hypothetical protein